MGKVDINWWDYFHYDENIPSCLRWKVNIYWGKNKDMLRVAAGDTAGNELPNGYYQVGVERGRWLVHQIVFKMFNQDFELGKLLDHIDGNPSNNQIENLRIATVAVNARNRKMYSTNSSGVTGVSLNVADPLRPYWRARWLNLDGKECVKNFSVLKLGEDAAFMQACLHRQNMISQLNKQGAGYTYRHGEKNDGGINAD